MSARIMMKERTWAARGRKIGGEVASEQEENREEDADVACRTPLPGQQGPRSRIKVAGIAATRPILLLRATFDIRLARKRAKGGKKDMEAEQRKIANPGRRSRNPRQRRRCRRPLLLLEYRVVFPPRIARRTPCLLPSLSAPPTPPFVSQKYLISRGPTGQETRSPFFMV
ncbi:hypothetical protein FA10DRAFT_267241 [Acaromyces ingoldii]|uniref:Uncharacterized protein n=1 Tax=Acaromyces ingoldii TaxID=215250 RepID=A0A316YP55_9BASI|nr:hypothetical protein FA10DRAFT_267241 [Acaromyces ingoldii]PWN90806.1 hypothetical protein FA10DRAFT_267241 [Acaromyces ingoldii]